MEYKTIKDFRLWLKNYVKTFYSKDVIVQRNIKLKEKHTYEVCINILEIGKSLGLKDNELYMAEAAALFHDIGRFYQFKTYKTFNDGKSENHAVLGLKVLEDEKVLANLEAAEKHVIEKSIKCHNMLDIPKDLTEKELLYAKLLRDADKIDILDITTKYYDERHDNPNPALEQISQADEISLDILQSLLKKQRINYKQVNTFKDRVLLQLSWIFDLNFPYSLKKIAEKGYIRKMIDAVELEDVENLMRQHLEANGIKYD